MSVPKTSIRKKAPRDEEVYVCVFVETPFCLQSVYIQSANWCEDWVLWLGEGQCPSIVIRLHT
jgi:hypothetical protein